MSDSQILSSDSLNTNKDVVYFKDLDVLRCLSVFCVVISHGYEAWIGWIGFPGFLSTEKDVHEASFIGELVSRLIGNLRFGVDLFFLISGFLITYLLLKEKERFGKISVRKFIIRRSLRIWPLYYLIVITAPLLIVFLNSIRLQWMQPLPDPNYFMYYLFLGNFDILLTKQWMFPFSHLWSVCVEEHFYIIWPFIIAFFNIKHLKYVFAAFITVCLATRIYYFICCPDLAPLAIYLNTLSRIDIIILGAIAAYIHFKKPIQLSVSKPIRILLFLVIISCFCIDYVYSFNSWFSVTIKEYLFCLCSGFLMLNFLFNDNKLIHFKKKGILHYLGKISFGIYIYHNIILGIIMDNVVARYGADKINFGLFLILFVGATLFISVISWEFFEKQILKFKSRFELIPTQR